MPCHKAFCSAQYSIKTGENTYLHFIPGSDLKSLVQSLAFLPLERNEIQKYVAALRKLFDIDQHIMCSSEWTALFRRENQMQVVPKKTEMHLNGPAFRFCCAYSRSFGSV